jgi:proline iminopeptidase
MTSLFPELEPHLHGMLDVGGGNQIYWESCGNPAGKPAIVLHGGPGSGCSPWHRRLFDPEVYRIVLFDQRNCGRSLPNASAGGVKLTLNTTAHLVADIERLRRFLNIERWMVLGGSWGSVLGLAYAETHPQFVSGMILFGVTAGRKKEFDWLFRGGVAMLFPEEWNRLKNWLSNEYRDEEVVDAYRQLLNSSDPAICGRAAFEWCLWESATPGWPPIQGLAERFKSPEYRLAFSRIVTHYVCHNGWLEDGILLKEAQRLANIPGALISGRFDLQSPIANAWELSQRWKSAELVIVQDAGHAANAQITKEIVRASTRFAKV